MGTALQPVPQSTPQSSTFPVKMAQQQIRQNYHEECEALVNKQINMQLYASNVYITKPTRMEWGTPQEAMAAVLELEKTVTCTLQDLEAKATEKKDFHLVAFIQRIQGKKVNIIKEIGDCQTKIKRAGDGAGLYIVDRELEKAVVTQNLMEMKTMAFNMRNCHVTDFKQEGILEQQVENIRGIADWLAAIRMA